MWNVLAGISKRFGKIGLFAIKSASALFKDTNLKNRALYVVARMRNGNSRVQLHREARKNVNDTRPSRRREDRRV